MLEERARHIASDLETAQASKARADEAAKQVAEATARARAEAQAAINVALDVAKREGSARIATLNERLEAHRTTAMCYSLLFVIAQDWTGDVDLARYHARRMTMSAHLAGDRDARELRQPQRHHGEIH